MEFNFCQYLNSRSYFARRLSIEASKFSQPLTSSECEPNRVEHIEIGGEIQGISVNQASTEICRAEAADQRVEMYSFTFNVICDESITEDGAPVLQSVDFSNECTPEVTYVHAAGCYQEPV